MPDDISNAARTSAINDLARQADIVVIAAELGMQVSNRNSSQPRAICPFHDDHNPSLSFYPTRLAGRASYHCFACGAHGDIFGLIKKLRSCEFPEALQWLATRYRVSIPVRRGFKTNLIKSSRMSGLEFAADLYTKHTIAESNALERWAESRGFSSDFLTGAEVYLARGNKLVSSVDPQNIELLEELQEAGVAHKNAWKAVEGNTGTLPMPQPPRDLFFKERVVFVIRSAEGEVVGFAGRTTGSELPKYLFSRGFPRSKTLYRLDRVRKQLRSLQSDNKLSEKPRNDFHLFIVEGLLDALRLESLGLSAIAIFGNRLTIEQSALIAKLAKESDAMGISLTCHLFLDTDAAGRQGMVSSVPLLLRESSESTTFGLDVICPPETQSEKSDPDDLFRNVASESVQDNLRNSCISVLEFLVATDLRVPVSRIDETLQSASDNFRFSVFRNIERRIDEALWQRILYRTKPFKRWLATEPSVNPPGWQTELESYLLQAVNPNRTEGVTRASRSVDRDDSGRLLRALQLAQSSSQRRELPVDEGSWQRMLAGFDVVQKYLLDRLLNPATQEAEPMIAVFVPKENREPRLKALPCPEDLTLQQYILNEILGDYGEDPRFMELIPAVRYWSQRETNRLETTGLGAVRPTISETVSFAYQVDMDVLTGLTPPRREGMFRPYFECWQDFIGYIDSKVGQCDQALFHVARLDIHGFYDNLPRHAITDVLLPSLEKALGSLSLVGASGPSLCARSFRTTIDDPEERAKTLVDWLCDQSFHYSYLDPGTGRHKFHEPAERGIPQGPDLSAYLANIALFPLDKIITDRIFQMEGRENGVLSETRTSMAYARYVDDLIIIAPTADDLSFLRSTIEETLGRWGLELSAKTDPLPAMSRAQVRKWLTDRRGAALGASGPFEATPNNIPIELLEPLAEAGDIDRGDSLTILHDLRMLRPDTHPSEIIQAVKAARMAGQLRHSDLVTAAKCLWRCVVDKNYIPENQLVSPQDEDEVAKAVLSLWTETTPSRKVEQNAESNVMALLDGLERFLSSRPDLNPKLSSDQQTVQRRWQEKLADWVHRGICSKLLAGSDVTGSQHMLEMRMLSIYRLAALVKTPTDEHGFPGGIKQDSPAKARLFISLAHAQEREALLNSAQLQSNEGWSTLILFHESMARLSIAKKAEPDPLNPIRARIEARQHLWPNDKPLEQVLRFWAPSCDFEMSGSFSREAIFTLNNVALAPLSDLLDKRRRLVQELFSGGNPWTGTVLPVPPGIGMPGLLGWEKTRAQLNRLDLIAEHPAFRPVDLDWKRIGDNGNAVWTCHKTIFPEPGILMVDPDVIPENKSKIPKWIARAFRNLAALCDHTGVTTVVPTAFNISGPEIGDTSLNAEWCIVGHEVSRSKVTTQAFIRSGPGLVPCAVLGLYDDLWRIGTALADRLGYIATSGSLKNLSLSAEALTVSLKSDWALEGMIRFSLHRLRGSSLPSKNLPLDKVSKLPFTVERVLRRLESFPESGNFETTQLRLVHLLATLSEGRAFYWRKDSGINLRVAGGAVALLTHISKPQFICNEELAHQLPRIEKPTWSPKRRAPLAWVLLSLRLRSLSESDPHRETDLSLTALSVGALLIAIEEQLRAQALEQWSLLDQEARNKILDAAPSLSEWQLDDLALLHLKQTNASSVDLKTETSSENVRFLFQRLIKATSEPGASLEPLHGITSLGWLVVLGTLVGAFSAGERGRGVSDDSHQTRETVAWLTKLAQKLSILALTSGDPPWADLVPVLTEFTNDFACEVFQKLAFLDQSLNVIVTTPEPSAHFFIGAGRGKTAEITTSTGTIQIPLWQTTVASLYGERKADGVERFRKDGDDLRVWYRWSECWCNGKILSIAVVQPGMASLAGLSDVVLPPEEFVQQFFTPQSVSSVEATKLKVSASKVGLLGETIDNAFPNIIRPSEGKSDAFKEKELLIELQQKQIASWRKRVKPKASEKIGQSRHARVALLQWDLDETYSHPLFDSCSRESEKLRAARGAPFEWNVSGSPKSCVEYRRRRLLHKVMETCNCFGVDILVLPEYSVRPDTISWLKEQIKMLSPSTTIWAGTYRQPPFSTGKNVRSDRDWRAIIPVVLPSGKVLDNRTKKYPALAANEIFNPSLDEIEPIFKQKEEGTVFDLRTYVLELICSEVFLATSPANYFNMAWALRELAARFGKAPPNPEQIEDMVGKDIRSFASYTSTSHYKEANRRSIILVPSMTKRAVDYAVLGQAGFLAAGLTTVFCNAVGSHGRGQSCFIGFDGWDKDYENEPGLPGTGPYHGVEPGIYRPYDPDRGWLGTNEQALVIADIDPLYAAEGKPRPQMLQPPLRLVAHLPILESWKPSNDPDVPPHSCRCKKMKAQLPTFATDLGKALFGKRQSGYQNTMQDENVPKLGDALAQIASAAKDSRWLVRRRKAYLDNHASDPQSWPPPVALDWIWLDLGDPASEQFPSIAVPPFTTAPEEPQRR